MKQRTSLEANALYQELFASSPDGILLIDAETQRVIEFNDAACRQLGYTREEFAGLHISDYEASETLEQIGARVQRILREGKVEFETLQRTKAGEIRHVHVWAKTCDLHGRPVFHVIFRDITERKQADQELRRSLDLLDETGAMAKVGGWEFDLETQALRWTREVYRIHEVEPAFQPSVAEAIQFYAPEARPVIANAVQAAIDAGTPFDLELPLVTWKGRRVWVRAQGTAERRGGKTMRLHGAFQEVTERRRAEDEVRGMATRLALLLDNITDGFFTLDRELRYTDINTSGATMVGRTPEQLVGRLLLDEFPQAADTPFVRAYRRVLETGEACVVEHQYAPLDRWFEARVYPSLTGVTVFFSDISDRKRVELALKEREETLRGSESRLRQAQQIARIGNWELDLATSHLWWSEEMFRIFEQDPTEFGACYEAFLGTVHPEDRDRVNAAYTGSLVKRTPYEITHRLLMADGRIKFVEERCETDYASDGTPLRSRGTTQDVTERVLADESRRLQSTALQAAADAIVITDRAGVIEWVNPAFTPLTGYTAKEALGKSLLDLVKSGELAPAFLEDLWETILAGRTWHGETINRRKDGSLYTEAQAVTPIMDASGAITHFVAIKEDITERLQLEAQLRQAQKMEGVGRLASGIAHDFNNLLTVINGMSDLLLAQGSPEDPAHEDVLEIRRAGERAATLTRQLLAFSRQQILEPRVMNLATVVAGMESLLRRLLGEDIDLVVVPTPGLGQVKADPGQIEQVITNLAVNARDAMPQGGRLTIETQNIAIDQVYARQHGTAVPPGSYVMLAVSDSGVGMDEATRARIFEPFFTTKAPGKGTGLGLSTVYGIVKQSHGFIWVYTEVGQGTSFKVYLPQVTEATDTGRPEPATLSSAGTETILLVEDNEALRKLATRVLEPGGYTVLGAASGEEALRLLQRREGPMHLLLSDVVMPGMSGRHLAEQVTRARPAMKVLFMSGYTDDTVVRHGVLDAQVPFLKKPFTAAELLRKVRSVLDS